jgi:hypothetical protein
MRDAAFGQLDFEAVFRLGISVAKRSIGGAMEHGDIGGAMKQSGLGFVRSPGFRAKSTERDSDEAELPVGDLGNNRGRGKGEFVGCAVA